MEREEALKRLNTMLLQCDRTVSDYTKQARDARNKGHEKDVKTFEAFAKDAEKERDAISVAIEWFKGAPVEPARPIVSRRTINVLPEPDRLITPKERLDKMVSLTGSMLQWFGINELNQERCEFLAGKASMMLDELIHISGCTAELEEPGAFKIAR